jgi:hypothetical protein
VLEGRKEGRKERSEERERGKKKKNEGLSSFYYSPPFFNTTFFTRSI